MQQKIAGSLVCAMLAGAAAAADVRIDLIERQVVPPPILSNMIAPPDDLGVAGARLGVADISTTGKFLGHRYELHETLVPPDHEFLPVVRATLAAGARLLVVKAPAEDLLALADLPEASGVVIFNSSEADDVLRGADCRANVLHTTPSLAMRADALSQFVLRKRWTDLVMVQGPHAEDTAFADAMHASLVKFGMTLKAGKTWNFDADMRRVASEEIPLFTQDLPDHDLLLVADERGDFARYIAYNTWIARPLAGSEGIMPKGWSDVVENWGAAQLQSRFRDGAHREMQAEDFAAWAAVSAIGEAVTRTNDSDPVGLRSYLLSDQFRLAGFLGMPLSFRDWDGQMRQPVPLVTDRAVVGVAPLEGFLHEHSELDTLGRDRPGTECTRFQEAS